MGGPLKNGAASFWTDFRKALPRGIIRAGAERPADHRCTFCIIPLWPAVIRVSVPMGAVVKPGFRRALVEAGPRRGSC